MTDDRCPELHLCQETPSFSVYSNSADKKKDRVRVTEPFSPPQSLGSQSVSAHGELLSFLQTIKTEMAPR